MSFNSKIAFQFTYTEVYHADFRRFQLLFGNFDRLAPHEVGIVRQFCGCLSISFDPALHSQSPSPLQHPAFHRFARRFLTEVPALPYLADLQDNALLIIVMGSLDELTAIEVDGAQQKNFVFNPRAFADAVAAMKDQAATWAKKADFDAQEISDRRVALQHYFDRPIIAPSSGWSL
jgi:hypothetical protein